MPTRFKPFFLRLLRFYVIAWLISWPFTLVMAERYSHSEADPGQTIDHPYFVDSLQGALFEAALCFGVVFIWSMVYGLLRRWLAGSWPPWRFIFGPGLIWLVWNVWVTFFNEPRGD